MLAASENMDEPTAYIGQAKYLLDDKYSKEEVSEHRNVVDMVYSLANIICEANQLGALNIKGIYSFNSSTKMFAYERNRVGKGTLHVNIHHGMLTGSTNLDINHLFMDALIRGIISASNLSHSEFDNIKKEAYSVIYVKG